MNYKAELTAANTRLADDPRRVFIGYGLKTGRALGTLKDVPAERIIETPVAENLMCGIASGMALAGMLPVVFIERFDFALCAADAIVNHACKIADISRKQFGCGVIYRVVVGNRTKPLFTGVTHTQNFTRAFMNMGVEVIPLKFAERIAPAYDEAAQAASLGVPVMLVEHKDLL